MTTITLEQIEARHTELAEMITKLKAQPPAAAPTIFTVAEARITLQPGERYAGLLLSDNGQPSHHLVLLPGDSDDINWSDAKEWATSIGGELPTRREQSLLFANLKSEFQPRWYWSSQVHESDGSYAWGQDFDDGGQYYPHQSYEGRARAVRRLPA
jgi:hypothetical protein